MIRPSVSSPVSISFGASGGTAAGSPAAGSPPPRGSRSSGGPPPRSARCQIHQQRDPPVLAVVDLGELQVPGVRRVPAGDVHPGRTARPVPGAPAESCRATGPGLVDHERRERPGHPIDGVAPLHVEALAAVGRVGDPHEDPLRRRQPDLVQDRVRPRASRPIRLLQVASSAGAASRLRFAAGSGPSSTSRMNSQVPPPGRACALDHQPFHAVRCSCQRPVLQVEEPAPGGTRRPKLHAAGARPGCSTIRAIRTW